MILVLEDSPGRLDRLRAASPLLVVAHDRVDDFLAAWRVHRDQVALVSLDMHLASRAHGSGLHAALALSRESPACPVIVHSSDSTAAGGIVSLLTETGWRAVATPFEAGRWAATVRTLLDSPSGNASPQPT